MSRRRIPKRPSGRQWAAERRRRRFWERVARITLLLVLALVVVLGYLLIRAPVVVPAAQVRAMAYRPREVRPSELFPGQRVILEATAYTAGPESTGKRPGDPGYGVTASGVAVQEWHTAAGGTSFPFGTRLFIPEFADKPNGGWFVVEDRGSAISNSHVDIYMSALQDALRFGRRPLAVYIVTP